ncbi:hypothetical protein SBOR_2935 [Sclerotinia borealis F-4128]|uniref:Uncharacterized protein n=1 Tax=Sclerotinia borealis (strain F-4128) TaxID=1432307 RepID=W9CLE1_SCLBF|nr:hypothetical protein SBOR_2935 [Sclerotinia borealis F-4128]
MIEMLRMIRERRERGREEEGKGGREAGKKKGREEGKKERMVEYGLNGKSGERGGGFEMEMKMENGN